MSFAVGDVTDASLGRERDHLGDDLVEREAGGVDRHGVGRRPVYRARLGGVALVAKRLLALDLLGVGAELGRAPGGALRGVGGEEDLDRRIGGDDGGDVAAVGDPVALGHDRLLAGDEDGPHAGVGGDPRGRLGHRRAPDLAGDVAAVDQHAVADLDRDPRGDLRGGLPGIQRGQADGAVHRPGVEVREAELARDGAGHG